MRAQVKEKKSGLQSQRVGRRQVAKTAESKGEDMGRLAEQGFTILVVDDEVDLATNIRDILDVEGYKVAIANDGETALAICHENHFDLALVDIKLPDISGIELVKRLTELSPSTEYIIITGYASLDTAIDAVAQKAILTYETKPLDMWHILSLVRQACERKQTKEELERSYERLQRTLEGTVSIVASIIEARDPYTAGHQQRVAKLACAIAEEMRLSQLRIDGIRFAGMIHDLGKIAVPAEILSKQGRLSDMEFNIIKIHSKVGYDILKSIEFPWPIAKIILQHHKRLDGSGYPECQKDEEFMLEARILGVADVVEAMASHRPYRPALGIGAALEEISKNSGILYDPKVVDACFKLFYEKEFKFE